MSKAERLREMQQELTRLREENKRLEAKLSEYRKRDMPLASDYIKEGKHGSEKD